MVYIKSSILGVLITVFSVPFWFFYYDVLQKEVYDGIALVYAALFLSLYLMAVSVLLLFAEHTVIFFVPLAVSTFPALYFFGVSVLMGAVSFLYVVCALHACSRVRWERDNRLQFKSLFLLRQGVPLLLTALTLMLAAAYFTQTSHSSERITIRDIIPPSLTTAMLNRITPFASEQFGIGLDTNRTVDEYIQAQLKATGVDVSRFSSKERDTIFTEMRDKLSRSLSEGVADLTLKGDERMGDVLYRIIERKGESLLVPYEKYIPFVFAVGFFLFLRTVAFPYGWLVVGVSAGIVALLRKTRVIQRVEEQTVRERFEWTQP